MSKFINTSKQITVSRVFIETVHLFLHIDLDWAANVGVYASLSHQLKSISISNEWAVVKSSTIFIFFAVQSMISTTV